MNDINEELNDMGQSVISGFQYIYCMSDIIMPVHTHMVTNTDWCVSCCVGIFKVILMA